MKKKIPILGMLLALLLAFVIAVPVQAQATPSQYFNEIIPVPSGVTAQFVDSNGNPTGELIDISGYVHVIAYDTSTGVGSGVWHWSIAFVNCTGTGETSGDTYTVTGQASMVTGGSDTNDRGIETATGRFNLIGQDGAPGGYYGGVLHATYTPPDGDTVVDFQNANGTIQIDLGPIIALFL